MNRGLAKLSDIIAGFQFPPEPVKEIRAPKPTPPKVVGDPTRTPVNRQAALIITKANWLCRPLPPEPLPVPEMDRIKAELATLRLTVSEVKATNAALIRKNESLSQQLREAHKKIAALTGQTITPPTPGSKTQTRKEKLLERLKCQTTTQ